MELDAYVKMCKKQGLSIGDFCKKIKIHGPILHNYRTKKFRPRFHHAMKIVDFTNGLVTFEELGWKANGERVVPWTLNELKNSFDSNGTEISNPISTNTMDSSKKGEWMLLQPEIQREGA